MDRKAVIEFTMECIEDESPDLSHLEGSDCYSDCTPENAAEYERQDAERLASYGDSWHMLGVRARAVIHIPHGINPDCWITSTMRSPGLWGVESDSDDSYLAEIYEEEKATLLSMLESLKTFEVV